MHKLRALTFDNLSYTDSKEYLQFVSMGGLRKLLHNTLKLDKNSVSAKQKKRQETLSNLRARLLFEQAG